MMNKIQKVIAVLLVLLSFTVLTTKAAQAANTIPAEVIKVADPQKVNDDTFTQQVILRFPSGNQSRTEAVVFNYPSDSIKVPLKQGDRVSVKVDANASLKYEVVGYDRVNDLLWLPALFIGAYVIILGSRNIKRLALQLVTVIVSVGALALGILIKFPSVTVLGVIVVMGLLYFVIRFKRRILFFISGLSFAISMLTLFTISYFLIDVLKIQTNIVEFMLSFYNLSSTTNPYHLLIACILIAATGGIMNVISYQVKEGVVIKTKENHIERNKLIIRAARMGIKVLQEKTFTFFTLITGLLALFIAPFLTATNISETLNINPISTIVGFVFLVLIGWLITIPITAVIEGFLLGKVPSHKLITSETIDEFEGFI